jgi:ribokinase
MRTAVVGHVEWIEFGHVERVPKAGDIVHATDPWEEPGGGGAVSAAQLALLSGDCTFYTALGDDERGAASKRRLEELGVRVEAVIRNEPTRRGVVFVDANGERTITTLGRRTGSRGTNSRGSMPSTSPRATPARSARPAALASWSRRAVSRTFWSRPTCI